MRRAENAGRANGSENGIESIKFTGIRRKELIAACGIAIRLDKYDKKADLEIKETKAV